MTLVLGIDPGTFGALALLDDDGELMGVDDMPLAGGHVDGHAVAELIYAALDRGEPVVAVIEDVHSMPRQGVATTFKFGRAFGIVIGACTALGLRVEMVSPHRWKKAMRLPADKEIARARAIDRWPDWHHRFKNKKDADRAEAALIALWWIEDNTRIKPKESA